MGVVDELPNEPCDGRAALESEAAQQSCCAGRSWMLSRIQAGSSAGGSCDIYPASLLRNRRGRSPIGAAQPAQAGGPPPWSDAFTPEAPAAISRGERYNHHYAVSVLADAAIRAREGPALNTA